MKERKEKKGLEGYESWPKYIGVEYTKMDCYRICARIIHCILYTLFASVWFYFAPWSSLPLTYRAAYEINNGEDGYWWKCDKETECFKVPEG